VHPLGAEFVGLVQQPIAKGFSPVVPTPSQGGLKVLLIHHAQASALGLICQTKVGLTSSSHDVSVPHDSDSSFRHDDFSSPASAF
jgi:hypothetical protein